MAVATNDLEIRLFFAVLTLAIGCFLLVIRHYTLTSVESAEGWTETLCVIERSEFVFDDEIGERDLRFEFSYWWRDQRYTSDRLDLVPGEVGDEAQRKADLQRRFPKGSETTCFVDPADPRRAVLDRGRGSAAAGNLLLIAFPWLTIGMAFGYSCLHTWIGRRAPPPDTDAAKIAPPPRRVPLVTVLAFLLGTSAQSQLAWAFMVGFTYWFSVMDGPEAIADFAGGRGEVVVGRLERLTPADQWVFGKQVFEYGVRYEYDGQEQTTVSYAVGAQFELGDTVNVVHYPWRPDASHLEGFRRRPTPRAVLLIPLGVMLLLAFGIVAAYAFNAFSLPLLWSGAAAVSRPGEEPLGQRTFEVEGVSQQVNPRSPPQTSGGAGLVLYDPARPAWNRGLSAAQRGALASRGVALASLLMSLVVPVVCLPAIVWLCFVARIAV